MELPDRFEIPYSVEEQLENNEEMLNGKDCSAVQSWAGLCCEQAGEAKCLRRAGREC